MDVAEVCAEALFLGAVLLFIGWGTRNSQPEDAWARALVRSAQPAGWTFVLVGVGFGVAAVVAAVT